MPHSTEMEPQSSPGNVKDEPMEDDAAIPNDVKAANGDDVDMTEAQEATKEEEQDEKKDVKLEDLFADVESDEEFPSSAPVAAKSGSSSPTVAPASPT